MVENEQTNQEIFKFSKKLSISDSKGNSANLTIYANSSEAIEYHSSDALRLITNEYIPDLSGPYDELLNELDDENEIGDDHEDLVFIKVENFDFNENVKSFSIRAELEPNQIGSRAINFYHYQYGSNDVNGAAVRYTEESRSKEYLKVKFSKKTSSDNWFWQTLSTAKLSKVGDLWIYCSGTYWEEFRLKVSVHNPKTGTIGGSYVYAFLVDCQ